MFNLLAEHSLLTKKHKRAGCVTTLSKNRFKMHPNIM